MSVVCRRMN